jgi:hypothetical protein
MWEDSTEIYAEGINIEFVDWVYLTQTSFEKSNFLNREMNLRFRCKTAMRGFRLFPNCTPRIQISAFNADMLIS